MTGARAAMEPLLFLCHRLPYPPNKGDKVRSCHFLKHLARRYRVFLGTFVDDPADWQHVESVKALCADVHVELFSPRARRVGSTTGFLTGEALTLPYFRSRRLRAWVQATTRREGIPENNPLNPKYRALIAVWRRLPIPVANFLGPHVVKNLG